VVTIRHVPLQSLIDWLLFCSSIIGTKTYSEIYFLAALLEISGFVHGRGISVITVPENNIELCQYQTQNQRANRSSQNSNLHQVNAA
jgi:hypothetical protein